MVNLSPERLERNAYTCRSLEGDDTLSEVADYVCEVDDGGGNSSFGVLILANPTFFPDRLVPHENISPNLAKLYIHQFSNMCKLINPITFFYKGHDCLSTHIQGLSCKKPDWTKRTDGITYNIWKIPDTLKKSIKDSIGNISQLYVADGHHRIQALTSLSISQHFSRRPSFMSLLFHESNINIKTNDRYYSVRPAGMEKIFIELGCNFQMDYIRDIPNGRAAAQTYVYLENKWYRLSSPKFTTQLSMMTRIEDILHKYNRKGDIVALETAVKKSFRSIQDHCVENNFNMALTLPALTSREIYACSDESSLFPENSTHISPKIPNDLFVYNLQDGQVRVRV